MAGSRGRGDCLGGNRATEVAVVVRGLLMMSPPEKGVEMVTSRKSGTADGTPGEGRPGSGAEG